MLETKILNSKGEKITLNDWEQRLVDVNQRALNSLGYEVDVTTLTGISKKVSEQKFYQISPAEFMPVAVGNQPWSTSILTYRSYQLGDDFSTGIINQGSNNGRLATANTGVDSLTVKVNNWAKEVSWTHFELQQASKSGNWDLITSLQKSRKTNWDLGIQKVAFLGLTGDSSVKGLLNQSGVTNDTSLITSPISGLSTDDLKDICKDLIEAYRANCVRTCWPTHFAVPESDYNGMASQSSPDFPIKSVLQVLEETFQTITRNKGFKILPLAYGDVAYNDLTVQRYALYNGAEEESLRMDIPVDYQATMANSLNNFSFQNVGYGQFTGVLAYRPLEMLYFSYTP